MPNGSNSGWRGNAIGSRQEAALSLARQSARSIGRGTAEWEIAADHAGLARATIEARTALEAAANAAAEAAERALSVAEALDEALARLEEAECPPRTTRQAPDRDDRLSPREQEVLALVAEGRTNKAIADALFVSPNTIKTHVASLLHKLHADTRTQLATIATRHEQSRRVAGIGAAPG